jgi:O-antigen ligase
MTGSSFDVVRNAQATATQQRGGYRPGLIDIAFSLFALATYEGAFFPLFRPTVEEGLVITGSDPVAQMANGLVLLGVAFMFVTRKGLLRFFFTYGRLFIVTAGVAFISAIWSLDPILSFRRGVSLLNCFGFGFYVFMTFGPRGFIRLSAWSLLLATFASFVALAAVGARTYDHGIGGAVGAVVAFHGVFSQKNELSIYMLLGLCSWFYLGILQPCRQEVDRKIWPIATLMMMGAMALSKGTTSILTLGLVVILAAWLRIRNPRARLVLLMSVLAGSGTIVALLTFAPDTTMNVIGKDPTLTGRIPLWIECLHAIAQRPILGYGYGAFWNPDSAWGQYIWQMTTWVAPSAHNGFLQLLLDLGAVGLALYSIIFGKIIIGTLQALRRHTLAEAQWLALALLALVVENFDEGTLAWPDALAIHIAFGGALVAVWRANERHRAQFVAVRRMHEPMVQPV